MTAVQTATAGWIYVIHTVDDPNAYVGQTVQPPWLRIGWHRRNQTWGGRILPGRQGYTIIRRVDSHGDPAVDAIALDLAEAEEIRRRHPTANTNRPDPAIFHARMAVALGNPTGNPTRGTPRRAPHPTAKPHGGRTPRPTAPRGVPRPAPHKPFPWGLLFRIPVGFLCAWAFLRVGLNLAHDTGTPWWPWVLAPVGFFVGPAFAVGLLRQWGWIPQRRRPRARRY